MKDDDYTDRKELSVDAAGLCFLGMLFLAGGAFFVGALCAAF